MIVVTETFLRLILLLFYLILLKTNEFQRVIGAGYYYLRIFERLIRGIWIPTTHEILQPSL